MAGPVFKSAGQVAAGVFSAQKGGMSTDDGDALGLVTNCNIQFSQQVNRIFDMNQANQVAGGAHGPVAPMYYIGGRAQGQLTIGRVLGPQGSPCAFYDKFGDVCNIQKTLGLTFYGGKGTVGCPTTPIEFDIKQPLLTNIGITQNSNDNIVNENVTLMFADLHCK